MIVWARKQTGFTIVELLIVIVVIAILAAITIVSYAGITNRANDNAVQADLKSFAQKIEIFKNDPSVSPTGYYPSDATDLSTAGIRISKNSYTTVDNNLLYCRNSSTVATKWGVVARSKSGKSFTIGTNTGGVKEYTDTFPTTQATVCPAVDGGSAGVWGYNGSWGSWVNG